MLAAVLILLASAPAALGAATATDEYSLQLPGAESNVNSDSGPIAGGNRGRSAAPRQGVAGESDDAASPLHSASALVGPPVTGILVAMALGGVGWSAATRTRRSAS